MKTSTLVLSAAVVSLLAFTSACQRESAPAPYRSWDTYSGGPESIRYSKLDQINRNNVKDLQVAWRHETGDEFPGSEMQCNPIIVNGVFYATTPRVRVIALNAANGELLWSFDPDKDNRAGRIRNRGVMYWNDGADGRIYVAAREYLYALNAKTGKPVPSFGAEGRIDLREGLGRDPETMTVSASTPGVIYKDMLILGSIVSESLPAAPGHVRAFDLRTGKIRWTFHTIPQPGEFGYETWPKDAWQYIGGANNWAGMSLDEKRGMVFVPTGSATFDFYGANRAGDNLFANCLIALKADTGERVWHFQFIRHDVWDRDLPAPPSLVTVERDGRKIDGVAQTTKSGHVFVFDRDTGKPLFPIEYRKVSTEGAVDGEKLADTQPFPLLPPPFARQELTPENVTKRTAQAQKAVLAKLKTLRNGGQFVPPSREGTVIFPGLDGGAEWGGSAFDPETGLLYVNSNEMTWVLKLVEKPANKARTSGRELYVQQCATCHRDDLRGSPPEFPALLTLRGKRSVADVTTVINKGAGRMPGFSHLDKPAVAAIARYIAEGETVIVDTSNAEPSPIDLKYRLDGYTRFTDPDGYAAVEPPWGTLNAINLNTGEIAWKVPFGEIPDLAAKGMKNTGSENYGGPVVTAGGLVFIGATNRDRKFRAFDKASGEILWEATLPAAGNATPAVYEVNGKQYVVIGAGGGKWGQPSGGSYTAFALK